MIGADNWFWFGITVTLTILTVFATWFLVIIGRDRPPALQRRGEETIERYGDIEEDRAPPPKFLTFMYWGMGAWAIGYAVWTGVNGLWK